MEKLQKGAVAPDFTYNTAYETDKNLHSQLLPGGGVLFFSRYIGCSLCRLSLIELCGHYERYQSAQVSVFFVIQSKPQTAKPVLDEMNVPFDVILDPDMQLYKLYGVSAAKSKAGLVSVKAMSKLAQVKKLGLKHGEYEGEELQLPAVFALDGSGGIKLAHYAKNLGDMPETDEILEYFK